MNQHPTSRQETGNAPQIHSLAFGFTRERKIVLIAFSALILWVYFITQNAQEATSLPLFILLALVFLTVFNIGLTVTDNKVQIRNCGVAIYRFALSDIKRVAKIEDTFAGERWTFGLHYIGGGWSFHVGAANIGFQLTNGKVITATVQDPEAIMDNIKAKEPAVELISRRTSSEAMLMAMSFSRS